MAHVSMHSNFSVCSGSGAGCRWLPGCVLAPNLVGVAYGGKNALSSRGRISDSGSGMLRLASDDRHEALCEGPGCAGSGGQNREPDGNRRSLGRRPPAALC